MKTSNYIFLSFLIFLFGGIFLLFIGAKYYKGADNEDNFLTKEKPLQSFSVVVAEPGAQFVLKKGTENKIIQMFLKNSIPNFAPFVVRNDTLFVYAVKKEHFNKEGQKGGFFFIVPNVFCQNVKSIVAKEKADVSLSEFENDSLNIDLNSSKLNWSFSKVKFVSLIAKDSDIYLQGEKLDKVALKLDKTQLRVPVSKRIENLSGSLKNGSACDFTTSNSVNLDIDETSKYSVYTIVN